MEHRFRGQAGHEKGLNSWGSIRLKGSELRFGNHQWNAVNAVAYGSCQGYGSKKFVPISYEVFSPYAPSQPERALEIAACIEHVRRVRSIACAQFPSEGIVR